MTAPEGPPSGGPGGAPGAEHRAAETRWAVGTTELGFYVLLVGSVLLAGVLAGTDAPGGFGTRDVWLCVTVLTVGYLISRGLAKSGSRHDR